MAIEIDYEKLNYPIIINVSKDYWVTNLPIEYIIIEN